MAITLKAARVNANLPQRETLKRYYDETGKTLSQATLVRWEQNKTFPTLPQFSTLCRIYGVQIGDIFVPETLT